MGTGNNASQLKGEEASSLPVQEQDQFRSKKLVLSESVTHEIYESAEIFLRDHRADEMARLRWQIHYIRNKSTPS